MKSLYVHIPFCEHKCFYCSFVVSVGQRHRVDEYLDCLAREMAGYKREAVQTVYVGGGTPTLMADEQLGRLCGHIRERFNVDKDAEWTVEANPEGLSEKKLKVLKAAGVNRISLGVQTFNGKYLQYLGRNHSARSAMDAYAMVRSAGYTNVNVDIMFSFPGQTRAEIEEDMNSLITLGSEHISLYTLTVEENSRFYARQVSLDNGQKRAGQYQLVCGMLDRAGYGQYEISNFAKSVKTSAHNLNYWEGGQYIGLGVGAHSYVGSVRSWNTARLREYLARLKSGVPAREGCEKLDPVAQMKECLLFGLRMNRGVDLKLLRHKFGCFLSEDQQREIGDMEAGGFLETEGECLKATAKGRLVLDELCARLI